MDDAVITVKHGIVIGSCHGVKSQNVRRSSSCENELRDDGAWHCVHHLILTYTI